MNKYITLLILFLIVGCASPKTKITKIYYPDIETKLSLEIDQEGILISEEHLQQLEQEIKQGLIENGLLATKSQPSHHLVNIKIQSFRMRDDAARLTVGVLAGCDTIKSTISVTDQSTNENLGESQISIEECAAWGVASQVINEYTQEVIAFLTRSKP